MTGMSVMEVPWAWRMSPRALGRMAELSAEVPAPTAKPERWLKGGGDARPVHSMAQNICLDVMAQYKLCTEGGASRAVVGVRAV
jgi:hypothetical protein